MPVPLGSGRCQCPSCQGLEALLTHLRFGVQSFFCPDCDYSWDQDRPTQRATIEGDMMVTPVAGHYAIGRIQADGWHQSFVEAQTNCLPALKRACELAADGHRVFLSHGTRAGTVLVDPSNLGEYARRFAR